MDTKEKVEGGLKLAKIITDAKVWGVILVAILVFGGCFCYAVSQPGNEMESRVDALEKGFDRLYENQEILNSQNHSLEVKVDGIASQLQLITELLKQR